MSLLTLSTSMIFFVAGRAPDWEWNRVPAWAALRERPGDRGGCIAPVHELSL
jgi:hypothetical protein